MVKRTSRKRRKTPPLSTLLRELANTHPKTATHLSTAQSNREERLFQYLAGARLKGYEELITHLEELEPVFTRNRKLREISFLISRARCDFHTALAAALSGFHSVAHDAMRDVMEMEFLLREFYYEPQHIQQWVMCTPMERNKKFRPALLRQRHANRLGKQPQDLPEASDYRGHSMSLHVSPYRNLFGGPGLSNPTMPFGDDSCFWEIFEHGRRMLFAAHSSDAKLLATLRAHGVPNVHSNNSVGLGSERRRCDQFGRHCSKRRFKVSRKASAQHAIEHGDVRQ